MTTFAFVFPGQGSQSVGMLDAWGDHPAVRATLEEASQALGEDLAQLIAQGPKEALALTTNTQPVMLVAGVAAYRAWLAEGGAAPAVVAGHSLGEYSALVASGVLTLAQAAPLVRLRAAAMQEAVPVGVGAMGIASVLSVAAHLGVLRAGPQAFSAVIAMVTAFVAAPLIAWWTKGRYYIARTSPPLEAGDLVAVGTAVIDQHAAAFILQGALDRLMRIGR